MYIYSVYTALRLEVILGYNLLPYGIDFTSLTQYMYDEMLSLSFSLSYRGGSA